MAEQKAAFQMSLGFVIGLVFAIVLLSLALVWIRGVFEGFTGLTDDLTQQSQSALSDTFSTTTANFAVWPSNYELKPNTKLIMSAGIDNNAGDGQDHEFVINVIPAAASSNVLAARGCSTFDQCPLLKEEMAKWTTFVTSSTLVQISTQGYRDINIKPAADAVKGFYIFNVVACYDKGGTGSVPTSGNCVANSPSLWGGSAQQITITII